MRRYQRGFRLFAVYLTGRIPNHRLRILLYRHVFGVTIGDNSSIHWHARFFKPEGVTIGRNCVLGDDLFLDGRRGLRIGDNVNISGGVHIYTLEHDPQAPDFGTQGGPVTIGDRVYLATRSIILPGLTVGEGAVVAAGAVVVKDVPAYTIVGGVPAKVIGERNSHLDYELNYHLPFQ
jgi:acetyltransferase-like isoleucine patch superfamily enzyme